MSERRWIRMDLAEDRKAQDQWVEDHCRWWCGRLDVKLAKKEDCEDFKRKHPLRCFGCRGVVDIALKGIVEFPPFKGLRKMRLERGWTQTELARRAGISLFTLNAYECWRCAPSYERLMLLEKVLLGE